MLPSSSTQKIESFDDESIRFFHEHGYLIVPHFLGDTDLHRLRHEIQTYAEHHQTTQVRWVASHFDTFNGAEVDNHFPALREIYDSHLRQEIGKIDSRFDALSQRSVGLSVNVIPMGGKFQPHFDRHRLTAVLYVNDDYDGGEMRIYPRIRYWLGPPGNWVKKKMQRLLDKFVRRTSYVEGYARQVSVKPRAGDLLVFEGTRTYHAVMPVTQGMPRISVQFAYDHSGTTYDISDYYGKAAAA